MGLPPQRAEIGARRGIRETGYLSVFEKETRDCPGAVVSTPGLVLERYTPGVFEAQSGRSVFFKRTDRPLFLSAGEGDAAMKLELRHVACGYQKQPPILRDVHFAVETGQICCLLGPNGVGKTTLFKTILGLLPPLEGSVYLDGRDTAGWSAARLARYVAYVSQFHTPPFPYKVREVVLLGRISQAGYFGTASQRDWEIAEQAMEDMGVRHLRDVPYTDISGGERQLVMLARALAQQPRWLVMDEPTANLDFGNMVRVVRCIRGLRDRGYGVIMTTHSPDQAFLCEAQVALLQRGRPVCYGPAHQVITEKNMRDAYGVGVKIVEFFDGGGHLMRLCSPRMDEDK